ncbi:recombinase family protein [Synechococcus elongatus]|uniref:Recombinase family protein n=1 Tax=Synechococcus elongatus PCC 11801 TaxID=2219813 RepID=A0AAN1QNC1_SYNEL|nr:recombinase family protein [Synechococcus elongatus]AZB72447.1 hypothetical protein DOP62_06685 [Synechococcus elongatus PCC 11801]
MAIVAYYALNPIWETLVAPETWPESPDRVFCDLLPAPDRPQLQQLLTELQPGDRLWLRQLHDLGDRLDALLPVLQNCQKQSVQVQILGLEEPLPLDSAAGLDLLPLWAEVQRSQQRDRLKAGHAKNRLQALPPPGPAPFGYRRGKERYAIDRAAAALVRDGVAHFLIYGSLRGAARYVTQKHQRAIAITTVRRWLSHPVYRGDLVYGSGAIVADTHPALVSREEAAQIDRILRRNRRLPPKTASAPRCLAGLVQCQTCQAHLVVGSTKPHRSDREYLYLRSPAACHQTPRCSAIAYDTCLQTVIQTICQQLPIAVAALEQPDQHPAKTTIASRQAELQRILSVELPDLEARGILDAETAAIRRLQIQTELVQLRDRQAQLSPVNLSELVQAVAIPQFWQDLSEVERRFFFREFIREIQLERRSRQDWSLQLQLVFSPPERSHE